MPVGLKKIQMAQTVLAFQGKSSFQLISKSGIKLCYFPPDFVNISRGKLSYRVAYGMHDSLLVAFITRPSTFLTLELSPYCSFLQINPVSLLPFFLSIPLSTFPLAFPSFGHCPAAATVRQTMLKNNITNE
jgi:hypothetical protein